MTWYKEADSVLIVLLHTMYVMVSATVENYYCREPLTESSTGFLVHETYTFAAANNHMFLARPEWLRIATCFSAYIFLPGYLLVLYTAVTEQWATYNLPISLLVGMKIYAFSTVRLPHHAELMRPFDVSPPAVSLRRAHFRGDSRQLQPHLRLRRRAVPPRHPAPAVEGLRDAAARAGAAAARRGEGAQVTVLYMCRFVHTHPRVFANPEAHEPRGARSWRRRHAGAWPRRPRGRCCVECICVRRSVLAHVSPDSVCE